MRFTKNDPRTRRMARMGGNKNAVRCRHIDEDLAWKLRIARWNGEIQSDIAHDLEFMDFPDYVTLPTCKEIRAIIRKAERMHNCDFSTAEEYLINFRKDGYKND